MGNVGPFELVIVLIVALLVLGPRRLPDAGRALGNGIREFRSGLKEPAGSPSPGEQAGNRTPLVAHTELSPSAGDELGLESTPGAEGEHSTHS